jgi:hypothetical protein
MNITPLRLGGVPLHPVSVLGRYLPLRWQDTNARTVQRLAFGDLSRLGYPGQRWVSSPGPRPTASRSRSMMASCALKAGRVTMKPAIDRFYGPRVCFTDGTSCAPDTVICATGYRPGLEQIAGHLVTLDALGMPPFTGACSSPAHPGPVVLRPGPQHLRQHARPPSAGTPAGPGDQTATGGGTRQRAHPGRQAGHHPV